jgi:hypothetical protein
LPPLYIGGIPQDHKGIIDRKTEDRQIIIRDLSDWGRPKRTGQERRIGNPGEAKNLWLV